MKTLRWMNLIIKRKRWFIVILSFLQSLLAVLGIFFALSMRNAIDYAVNHEVSLFYQSVFFLVMIILLQIIIRIFYRYFYEYTSSSIENSFRHDMMKGILSSQYADISQYHSGELMNRFTSDVKIVSDAVVSLIPQLIAMGIKILGVLIVMYSIEPFFAYFFVLGGCCMSAVSLLPRQRLKNLHSLVQESEGHMRSFVQECLENLLVIHSFSCEKKMVDDNDINMDQYKNIRLKRNHFSNLCQTILSLTMQCGYLVGFIWGGYSILRGSISYGTLTAMIQLIGQIQTPFVNIGGSLPKFSAMLASAERLMELSQNEKVNLNQYSQLTCQEVYEQMNCLYFEDVSFGYHKDQQVLSHESFSINKGEFVAIVGESGAGKSTIMKLLLSVYQPDEGSIYFQMNDCTMPFSLLPKGMFAYVPQGNGLMSGTIKEVVGFSEKNDLIDDEKVEKACQFACADEFINQLPLKYETKLGEKGSGLSEGQMQRLAIARAIYSECPILLLDEATSALDLKTEQQLIQSLKRLTHRTIIFITHRQEAWVLCDRIIERKDWITDE